MKDANRKFWVRVGLTIVTIIVLWLLLPYELHLISATPFLPKSVRMQALKYYMAMEAPSQNKPMDFYGRVVDQDGNSIAGASVQIQFAEFSFSQVASGGDDTRHQVLATTDGLGNFSVHVSGAYVQLTQVSKPGYLRQVEPNEIFRFDYAGTDHPYQPDSTKPEVFTLWKLSGKPERLHDLSMDQMQLRVLEPSIVISIYLGATTRGSIARGKAENADIWLSLSRGPIQPIGTLGRKGCDWSYSLEMPQGGVIRTDTSQPYLAPENGYVNTYTYSARIADSNYRFITNDQFYVKARNGTLFGVIRIGVNVSSDMLVGVSGTTNPSGSRNLQPGAEFLNH